MDLDQPVALMLLSTIGHVTDPVRCRSHVPGTPGRIKCSPLRVASQPGHGAARPA
ncbi:hypothetical protein [Streptomyces microflavus]|uniref:hypothetical protein n=1 Tax=Streptomyces microflavus TaxID=1919 RepID=UPI0037F21E1D